MLNRLTDMVAVNKVKPGMTKRRAVVRTTADAIKAMGGAAALARWAGVSTSAVSSWGSDDWIPPGWHYRLALELERRGRIVDGASLGWL